jgi:hypothetical protein
MLLLLVTLICRQYFYQYRKRRKLNVWPWTLIGGLVVLPIFYLVWFGFAHYCGKAFRGPFSFSESIYGMGISLGMGIGASRLLFLFMRNDLPEDVRNPKPRNPDRTREYEFN